MKIAAFHGILREQRGAERAFVNMMLSLAKRKHSIDVFVLTLSEEHRNKLKHENITVTSLGFKEWYSGFPIVDAYLRLVNELRVMLWYRTLARRLDAYDVVFTHHFNYAPLLHQFAQKPVVYYCHEPPRQYYEAEPLRGLLRMLARAFRFPASLADRLLDRYCARKATLILTNSNYSRERLQRIYQTVVETNYLGVDAAVFKPLALPKENMVLSIGALHPKKAHDFVLRSLGLLEPKPKLVVIGAGSQKEKEKLHSLARKQGVTLDLWSNISDEELVRFYNKAKVNAMAYINEPSIEPEAFACGTPVVAVNEGGAAETLSEGAILTPRSERAFANAVSSLLSNSRKARQLGAAGRTWVVRHFTWDACAQALEKNMKQAVSSSVSSVPPRTK